jgi:hypothetical protein
MWTRAANHRSRLPRAVRIKLGELLLVEAANFEVVLALFTRVHIEVDALARGFRMKESSRS